MNGGGWKNALLGGYEIAWIQTLESGNPITFDFAGSPYNYYPTFAGNRRPDLVSQPTLLPNWGNVGGDRFTQANRNPVVSINNFAYPAAFTPGNAGRNIMTGTRLLWSQVSAKKNWVIKERVRSSFAGTSRTRSTITTGPILHPGEFHDAAAFSGSCWPINARPRLAARR